jgi:hypothetical protein
VDWVGGSLDESVGEVSGNPKDFISFGEVRKDIKYNVTVLLSRGRGVGLYF